MPVDPGRYESEYTNGEAKAVIAPLLGCRAEDLGEVLVIARASDGQKLGVFHTMYCQHEGHGHVRAIDLAGEYLQEAARSLFEVLPHHGPGGMT